MTAPHTINATRLLALLAERHKEDVFVPECKDGRTVGAAGILRLDAWAMVRSWSPVRTIGYEIKVSRGDWLGDRKWERYADLVHELWVVAPAGIVHVEELPQSVGLLVPTSTGSRLLTKRRAVRRDIDPSAENDLLRYVLMSRARIDGPAGDNAEKWRAWLAEREENRVLGHEVSRALAAKYWRDVWEVRERMQKLEERAPRVLAVDAAFRALAGRGIDTWDKRRSVGDALTALGLNPEDLRQLMEMGKWLTEITGRLRQAMDEAQHAADQELNGVRP